MIFIFEGARAVRPRVSEFGPRLQAGRPRSGWLPISAAFSLLLQNTLCHKVKDRDDLFLFKHFLPGSVLPDDLLQQIDVFSERLAARRRQRARRERTVVLIRLGHGHIAFLLQRANVRGEISVGHAQRVTQLGERQFRRGREHGHDGQPPFLVDHTVEL